jgi:hypothetical protein
LPREVRIRGRDRREFDKLARVLPESRVRELRDAVLNLEQLNDAARLAQLLARR